VERALRKGGDDVKNVVERIREQVLLLDQELNKMWFTNAADVSDLMSVSDLKLQDTDMDMSTSTSTSASTNQNSDWGMAEAEAEAEADGDRNAGASYSVKKQQGQQVNGFGAVTTLSDEKELDSGTTLAAWIWHPGKRMGYTVHVGDSRVAILSKKRVVYMTQDHKPQRASEAEWLSRYPGAVLANEPDRVQNRNGMSLGMSRSLGDFSFKRDGRVRALPEVRAFRFEAPLSIDIVIACDGLWDVWKAEEGVPAGRQPARELVEAALSRGTDDNVTVMVLRIRPRK
jgi:protein phosphatase 2C